MKGIRISLCENSGSLLESRIQFPLVRPDETSATTEQLSSFLGGNLKPSQKEESLLLLRELKYMLS